MNYRKTKTACYLGYVTHAVAVNLAPLLFACFQRTYEVSLGFLAILTFVTFIVQIAVDLSAVSFMEKVSFRALATVSQFTIAAGLVLMGLLPKAIMAEAALLIAAFFYSFGSGLAEVVLSPLVDALPDEENGSSLALLHSFYSWGHVLVIVVTTILLRFTGDELWFVVPVLWAAVPLYTAKCFCRVPMPRMVCHDEKSSIKSLFKCKAFVLFFVLMLCSGAAEQVMAQWSSFYAEVGLGVPKVAGDLLGPCIFALMMALERTFYGALGERVDLKKTLAACAVLTVACYFAASLVSVPFVSLLACGLSGVGVSIMWPGILSIATRKYPGGGASMFALLAFGGDVGCSIGPFLTGCVSEAVNNPDFSIRAGILAGAVFPIIMTFGVTLLIKNKSK